MRKINNLNDIFTIAKYNGVKILEHDININERVSKAWRKFASISN